MTKHLYPHPSSANVSAVMRANSSSNTRPELRLRSALHALGLRFRVGLAIQTTDLRTRADIVFTRRRLAIFVDGCYWHCCPEHGTNPIVNTQYWSRKLSQNIERDRAVDKSLQAHGWVVFRIWEHTSSDAAARQIATVLEELG
jgi:DNA mismatch endonuclease, patch repair protein